MIFVRITTANDPTSDPFNEDTQTDCVFVQILMGMLDRVLREITAVKRTGSNARDQDAITDVGSSRP
jgi:hypothetical protein